METCKYGSGAGKRKPTAVKRKGVVCRAYRIVRQGGRLIMTSRMAAAMSDSEKVADSGL